MFKEYKPLEIDGCYELTSNSFSDHRGVLTKIWHSEIYDKLGVNFKIQESYYSTSKLGVLRGMHFQIPPHDQYKLVCCLKGEIQDAMIDLREGSPTSQKSIDLVISSTKKNLVLIPPGIAHGFLSLSDPAVVLYMASTTYAPDHDTGLHWQDCNVNWKNDNPIISAKDKELPKLQEVLNQKFWD